MPRPRRLCALLAVMLASAGASACGKHPNEDARVVTAEQEGLYLKVSELKYQVQVSRQLNPYDVQDKPLLEGVPEAQRELDPDETWFAVLMRVQNETGEPLFPSGEIEIVDTQEMAFKPIALEPSNLYAYRSTQAVPAEGVVPIPDSPAYDTPAQGALLLFKLPNTALDNRPLELKIEGHEPRVQTGIIELDV